MSILEKEYFEEWMTRIMERFDSADEILKLLPLNAPKLFEGEAILDNQDVCQLLQISKRTLQRYRSMKKLPYHTLYHKTYYKESDVHNFIRDHFDESNEKRITKDQSNKLSL